MSSERIVLDDAAHFAQAVAQRLLELTSAAVAARGRCTIALAGGCTPRPVYQRLGRDPLSARMPWPALDFYFGDERAVPPDDERSNYRMARTTLFDVAPLRPEQVHRLEAERPDLATVARAYDRALPDRLDILLLGMGTDGHTASLFPGSEALRERERRAVPVTDVVPPRITITPPVIAAARTLIVLVSGADKAPTVRRALTGPVSPPDLPVQLALRGTWFLTREAAGDWTRVAS